SADPKMPSTILLRRRETPLAIRLPFTIAIKASTPPSPLLSARMITMWYLIVTTITGDQNTIDRTPSTFPGVTLMPWGPENEKRIAYWGLGPMSPYTTPRESTASAQR